MKHWPAIRTSIVLSVLFLVVYLGTNWLTALRNDVGVIVFDWERHIPFVPLMIVPYMSIDLFFVIAPFLCAGGDERRLFSKRIVTAIAIAGACFLLFPLRFSFERPQADGWLGAVFDSFREMDRPFNQLPSLHIALMVILADVYARHTKGLLRIMLLVWFGLIGLSTLLTYQHHFVDVAGGLFLAAICFHVHCGDGEVVPNRRVGGYYLAGMVLVVVLAWLLKRGIRVFQNRSADLPQEGRADFVRFEGGAGAGPVGTVSLVVALPAAMPGVGRGGAGGSDRQVAQ
jgi:hypothetical protein